MILNRVEFLLMNNPLRAALQRHVEARRFLRMGGPLPGASALEIGCGRGVGVEVILDVFGVTVVDAFDLDPRMVALARRRLRSRAEKVRLWVGDAAAIDAPDGTYDAVFDFGIIHHVPDWRDVIVEVHRVLKAGGFLFAEEPVGGVLNHPVMHRLFAHPVEDRFEAADFRNALHAAGFSAPQEEHFLHTMFWFVAAKPATAQQKCGPPNGGPATPAGSTVAPEGPPSVNGALEPLDRV